MKLVCARASTVGRTPAIYFEHASEHAQKRAAAATRAPVAVRPKALSMPRKSLKKLKEACFEPATDALSMVMSAVPVPHAWREASWIVVAASKAFDSA